MVSFVAGEGGRIKRQLCALLWERNGFYAFESALLVRPFDFLGQPLGVRQWNRLATWKSEFKLDLAGCVFFAEDAFGVQFCIQGESVYTFDPETGGFTPIADGIPGWASWILGDPDMNTGLPLAREWQAKNAPLRRGYRLLPKIPFVTGGKYAVENLYAAKEEDGMRFRASIANQLFGVSDGAEITFKVT